MVRLRPFCILWISVDDKAIEAYARTQLGFIKRAIAQFQEQPRASKRQYVSGETIYIWGKQYFLVFKPDNQKNSFEIQNQNIVLSMSAKSTVRQRDAYVKEEYRKILKEEIEKRLPKWEAQTGLKCDSWQTKYMVTKWGACSTDKKKLWFNLQLAQKPYACLDYIILHELTHLLNATYKALMRATISEALGLNGDPEEVDMLERKVEALNNKMLALVNESVSSGDGIEAHESEFMTLSQETELLKQRIAAIQESTAKDNGEQSRLEQIQAIISERESKCMEYDDSIVRQMVECIKVYPGGKLEIIFGGGYLVEESV